STSGLLSGITNVGWRVTTPALPSAGRTPSASIRCAVLSLYKWGVVVLLGRPLRCSLGLNPWQGPRKRDGGDDPEQDDHHHDQPRRGLWQVERYDRSEERRVGKECGIWG